MDSLKFNDLPYFDGNKGFAVVYLNGEFHLFFPYGTLTKSWVMHYASVDGFAWERKDVAVFVKKSVDSVTASVQNGKIYLYYLARNIWGRTDLNLTVSKDGESFLPYPTALLKGTALRDVKCFYSSGLRYIVGSEIKGDVLPTFVSQDGIEWQKSDVKCLSDERNTLTYLGAPSPFVAYDKSYVAYSMCGAHIAPADFNLQELTVTSGEPVHSFNAGVLRSTMLGEGKPLIFIGVGSSLVGAEIYPTDSGVGVRLYREMLRGAHKIADQGVEEGKLQPTEWMRESNIFHLFGLPRGSGVSLTVGDLVIRVGEYGELIIGENEIYPDGDDLEISLLDMGNMAVIETCDRLYPVLTADTGTVKLSGAKDFSHECYKIRGNYEL